MTEPDSADADRLEAFGTQLLDVHARLRTLLADLGAGSSDASSAVTGAPTPAAVVAVRDLRANCLTFCSALDRHHTGEDAVAFPALVERFPELEPTLEKLRQDHLIVDSLLVRLRDLAGGLGADSDSSVVRWVRGEIDGLSAIVESHFRFEERTIIAALNALDVPAWRENPPAFLARA